MGVSAWGALASVVKTEPSLTWEIPDYWSMEEAATVPVVYSTVCLFFKHFKLFIIFYFHYFLTILIGMTILFLIPNTCTEMNLEGNVKKCCYIEINKTFY